MKTILLILISFSIAFINVGVIKIYISIEEMQKQISTKPQITFVMDESCYKQIQNSSDGILRIKFNK